MLVFILEIDHIIPCRTKIKRINAQVSLIIALVKEIH